MSIDEAVYSFKQLGMQPPLSPNPTKITLISLLFSRDKNVTFNINDSAKIYDEPGFMKARPTVLYMHGYTESNQSDSVGLVARCK